MRRFVLALSLLCSVLLTGSPAHAAGLSGSLHPLGHLSSLLSSHTAHTRVIHTLELPYSRVLQTSNLRLPDSAFSPGAIVSGYDYPSTAQDADGNYFRGNHSAPYESFGQVADGYYQRADWTPSGYSEVVHFRYQGLLYANHQSAAAAWQDGVTYTQQQINGSSTDCTGGSAGYQCAELAYGVTTSEGDRVEQYVAAEINQCLLEFTATGTSAEATAVGNQMTSTENTMLAAALRLPACNGGSPPLSTPPPTVKPTPAPPPTVKPTPAPPPTTSPTTTPPTKLDFSVISVRAEKKGAKPDWNLTHPPISRTKVGTQVYLSIYFTVRTAPTNAPFSDEFTLRHAGKVVMHQKFNHNLPSDPSKVADTYRYSYPAKLSNAGGYTFTGRITISGQPQQLSARIRAAKQQAAGGATTFNFTGVQLLNQSSQPQSRFRPGDGFYVKVDFTAANLKGGTQAEIDVSLVSTKTSRALYQPVITIVNATNGPQSDRVHLFTPRTAGSSVKIVVSLTIGPITRRQSATLLIS